MLHIPRLVIAGLRGGSGKTILSIGLLSELNGRGLKVLGFKKGPDFIDPGWLSLACGYPCRNLDPYIMDEKNILNHFASVGMGYDITIIEGNRGIFDGLDQKGTFSTAQLSKLLRAPVCLIVDVTMATTTVAALVKGCQVFDPEVDLRAVIINRVATTRQESLIKKAIEEACGIPVVGAIPRKMENPFPERHMGLLPYQENEEAFKAVEWARRLVGKHVDVEILREIAYSAPPLEVNKGGLGPSLGANSVKIGVLLDKAFWFYYPENLELLRSLGAQLVYLDSLRDREVTDIHGIYVGGGFPETQAVALAKNEGFRKRLGQMIQNGLPVYAECGGLIYLGKEVHYKGNTYPMLDIFPIRFEFQSRPAGHGYTEFVAEKPNPYYEMNRPIKGHEFHYSIPRLLNENASEFVFRVLRGNGFDGKRDGIMKGAVLGTYMHVHALGEKQWAEGLVELSELFSLKAIGRLAP